MATIETNGIRLHYLEHEGVEPPLLLMPALSFNAHIFDGLVAAGLPRRALAVDLRGRGRSEAPPTGYTMADHAADIVGLLDGLGIARAVVGGHSFGGLLALYLAAHHPERVTRLVVMDAAARLHPRVRELIQPSLDRLGVTYESWEHFLAGIRAAPQYVDWWDPLIEQYYREDVTIDGEGRLRARAGAGAIAAAVEGSVAVDWFALLPTIRQPVLLLNAPGPYGPPGTPPVLPADHARESVAALPDGRLVEIPGNHMTMLYGEGATRIVAAIESFIQGG